ncbi:MAG TPA: type II secretion system protein GspJ [Lysobacter sp.]
MKTPERSGSLPPASRKDPMATRASLRGGRSRPPTAGSAEPASRSTGASLRGGFTLIELLTALLILSLLALMSYRSLAAVLDAREHVTVEADKWRHVSSFFARFERDVKLVAPRPVRNAAGSAPAWLGRPGATPGPRLEISRFASAEGVDSPRRVAYALNDRQEIELWLWPGLDVTPDVLPARYPVLAGVTTFEVQYLNAERAWLAAWPLSPGDAVIPQAVRLRIVLASGEDIVRVFALNS